MDLISVLNQYEKELLEKYQRCEKVLATKGENEDVCIQEKRHGDVPYYYMRKKYGGKKPQV